MRFLVDDRGVTPVVATLVLILVAIIGAISIAYLVGAISTDTAKRVVDPFAHATPTPGPQVLIVDSPQTYSLDQQLAQQYMATHGGVRVTIQSVSDEFMSTTSLSQNISDIVALSKVPSASLAFKDPKVQTHFIGGLAVVMIANSNISVPALSQSDLAMVYSHTSQSVPYNLSGLTSVVRNDDPWSEYIFAGWLTDDTDTSLDNYTAMPPDVEMYTIHGQSEVIANVSSTPGEITFVDWSSVANNDPLVSHIQVIPIVNKNNQKVQMPNNSAIMDEMINMSNTEYDDGLIGGLYYLTEGTPNTLTQNYIDWCQSTDAATIIHNDGMYTT